MCVIFQNHAIFIWKKRKMDMKMTDYLQKMIGKENARNKKDIIAFWRNIGFLDGLKEGGTVEWRCAKTMDLMANHLLGIKDEEDPMLAWYVLVFPMIRRCVTKNSNKITRVVKPQEIEEFLKEMKITGLIEHIMGTKGRDNQKRFARYLKNYLEMENLTETRLVDLMTLFEREDIRWIDKIFGCDYEAEVCAAASNYFCWSKKKGK